MGSDSVEDRQRNPALELVPTDDMVTELMVRHPEGAIILLKLARGTARASYMQCAGAPDTIIAMATRFLLGASLASAEVSDAPPPGFQEM